MSVVDADKGTTIQTLPIGVHIDAEAYDSRTKLIFNANRSSVTIIHQDSADKYTVVQNLKRYRVPIHLALDTKTGKLYLSTNKFAPLASQREVRAGPGQLYGRGLRTGVTANCAVDANSLFSLQSQATR